jgi:hypothetical protein
MKKQQHNESKPRRGIPTPRPIPRPRLNRLEFWFDGAAGAVEEGEAEIGTAVP